MTFTKSQAVIFRKFIGISLIALSLPGFTSLCLKEFPLALFGEHCTGVVRKVEVIQTSTTSKWRNGRAESRAGLTTIMHMAFATKNGTLIENRNTATFHTAAKVGDEHPMVYLPWRPENAKIHSAKQLWLPMITGVIFSVICFFLGKRCLRNQPFFPTPNGSKA
jgi:hypothetical protein